MIKYLTLRARHFKNKSFYPTCCPIANAAKEKFNADYANEGVDHLIIRIRQNDDKTIYSHLEYCDQYPKDLKLAEEVGFDNTKIRTIRLTLRE